MCADGFANGVIGEVELTVAYEGRLVRLSEVVVFKHLVEPFLLGIEWIDAANVAVMAESHAGVVVLRDDTMVERSETEGISEIPVPTGREEVEMHEESATVTQDSPVCQQRNAYCSTLPEIEEEVAELIDRPPQLSDRSVETPLSASSDPPEAASTLQSKCGVHSSEVTRSFDEWHERRLEFHARSDPNYAPDVSPSSRAFWKFKEGVDELRQIGAIVAASSESRPRAPPREKLHPLKCQRIPGWSKGFVTFRTPGKRNGSWMVSPSSGIEGGRGWATPACLVTAVDGLVQIPVTNADDRGCRWKDLRGKIEVVEFKEDVEVLCEGREANIIAALEEIEPEWLNCPIDSFDHLLDNAQTEEDGEEIQPMGRIELPPSRSGRTRWANPRYR